MFDLNGNSSVAPQIESMNQQEDEYQEVNKWLSEMYPLPLCCMGYADGQIVEEPQGKDVLMEDHANLAQNPTQQQQCNHMDFYDFRKNEELCKHVENIVSSYGIGTCGPRQFYGTSDLHLELERKFAQWMGCEASIIYPSHITIAHSIPLGFVSNHQDYLDLDNYSSIPYTLADLCNNSNNIKKATLKFGKIAIVDSRLNEPTQLALIQSTKGACFQFPHNDQNALSNLIKVLQEYWGCKFDCYVFLEGIYEFDGSLCMLSGIMRVVEERRKSSGLSNSINVILDDSLAVGMLGPNLKGSWEYYGRQIKEFYLIYSGLHAAFCSPLSICYGQRNVISHQLLGGSGYTFSASPPTFCVSTALFILEKIISSDETRLKREALFRKSSEFRHQLRGLNLMTIATNFEDKPSESFPIVCLQSTYSRCISLFSRFEKELGLLCLFRNDVNSLIKLASYVNTHTLVIFINDSTILTEQLTSGIARILEEEDSLS